MHKIIILFVLALFSINVVQATNWEEIDTNIYYDTDSIEYLNNGFRFWLKNNIKNGTVKELIYLNITEKQITTEQSYTYNKANALISTSKQSVPSRIIPDTLSEVLYQYFSNNKNLANKTGINTENVDFAPYMKEVQRRIKLNWDPPKGNEQKTAIVFMRIAKDGRLISCKIYKSSGSPTMDKAALKAVEITAPFKPLPSDFNGQYVDIHFTFDYRVFGSSN